MNQIADKLLNISRRLSAEHLLGSRRATLVAAFILFGGASIIGAWTLPEIPGGVRWGLLLLTGATLVPLGVALNAAEFALSAQLLGHTTDAWASFRTALIAGAFNLLPLPGAAVVRTQALYGLGSSYPKALGATLMISLAALGTAITFAGAILCVSPWDQMNGPALLTGGSLLLAGAYIAIRREVGSRLAASKLMLLILLVETASIAIKVARIYLVIVALRQPITSAQAAVIALVWVLTLLVGFFPGGLGVREILAAVFSPLVGIEPSVAVTTSAIDRVMGLSVLWIMTLIVMRGTPFPSRVQS